MRTFARAPPDARALASTLLSSLGDAYSNAKTPGGKAIAAYEAALTLRPGSTPVLSSLWFARAEETSWSGWAPLRRRLVSALDAAVQPESAAWEAEEARRACAAAPRVGLGPPPRPAFEPSPTTPYQAMSLEMPPGLRKRIGRSWATQLVVEGRRVAEADAEGAGGVTGVGSNVSGFHLAYISRRFEDYPGAHLLMGNFPRHSREAGARLACVATGPDDGSATRRAIAAACDSFEDASLRSTGETAASLGRLAPSVIVGASGWRRALSSHPPSRSRYARRLRRRARLQQPPGPRAAPLLRARAAPHRRDPRRHGVDDGDGAPLRLRQARGAGGHRR